MKYQPLSDYLTALKEDEWSTNFGEVEKVLGFELPNSARRYRPWWGNQGGNSGHSHAMSWCSAGWKTSVVNLHQETLVFVRRSGLSPSGREEAIASPATVADKILTYLSEHPEGATNREMAMAMNRSAPHIYQETTLLERTDQVDSVKEGKAKRYFIRSKSAVQGHMSPLEFQNKVQDLVEKYFGTTFDEKKVSLVNKRFDFVSSDGKVVGDAKYYSMVGGESIPPAKFSAIAEYVWLLEKTKAASKFLVFGNDRRVPEEWLSRYGKLVAGVSFFYWDGSSQIELLN